MATPRERGGGLSEASRLLQEGLQLLDERTREVDALVQDAKEEARRLTYDAQKRAQEITAEAERHRTELEEQVAVLRTEIAEVRQELAQLRAAQPQKGGRGSTRPAAVVVVPLTSEVVMTTEAPAPPAAVDPVPFGPSPDDPVAAADAADAAGSPRWGRPSSISAAQRAGRARSSRPRWLPRWLPFVILLLAGAGAVMASVNVQSSGRGASADPTSAGGTVVTFAPIATRAPTGGSGLNVAGVTSVATSVVAAGAAGSSSQPAPSRPPTLEPTRTLQTTAGSSTPTPRLIQTVASTRLPAAVVPPAPLVTPSAALPYDVSPDGPIVAAYTTYATYSVRPGDTLNRVATDFGVTGDSIIHASGLADPNLLTPGQVLTIPRESGWLYRVQQGETIDTVALRFGISTSDLIGASTFNSSMVRPGDLLFIPNRALPGTKQ